MKKHSFLSQPIALVAVAFAALTITVAGSVLLARMTPVTGGTGTEDVPTPLDGNRCWSQCRRINSPNPLQLGERLYNWMPPYEGSPIYPSNPKADSPQQCRSYCLNRTNFPCQGYVSPFVGPLQPGGNPPMMLPGYPADCHWKDDNGNQAYLTF